MKQKKELLYPFLIDCCQYTTDVFWENIFENLAYGITPYGSYISKGFLMCKYKNKEFVYKIQDNKDSKIIYEEIYNLLHNKMGILSQKENLKKKQKFDDTEKNGNIINKWSDIRKTTIKNVFIELFVSRMKNKYSLSNKQAKNLLSIIFVSIVTKAIKSQDINYQNGNILSINGIEFSTKKFSINYDLYSSNVENVKYLNKNDNNINLMSHNWDKYLENIRRIT